MINTSNKDDQITQIMQLLGQVSEKLEPGENDIKRWMAENFRNPKIVDALQDSTIITLRVLHTIGQLEPVNGITISKQSRIPKGSVSKVTRRLLAKKLITKETLPNNKKEILFRTTALGKQVFEAHQAFDGQMEKSFTKFLKKYDASELNFLIRILQDLTQTKFLN